MRKNSRNKGSRFERTIAKAFESWTGYKFSRTPGSGGWAKAKDAMGDLVCTDEKHSRKFPFSIECKNYQDIKFEHLMLELKSCKIDSFWKQAEKDANRSNKIPILIMRYNSMPKGEAFFILGSDTVDSYILTAHVHDLNRMEIKTRELHLYVYMLKQIQSVVDYKKLYKFTRGLLKSKK